MTDTLTKAAEDWSNERREALRGTGTGPDGTGTLSLKAERMAAFKAGAQWQAERNAAQLAESRKDMADRADVLRKVQEREKFFREWAETWAPKHTYAVAKKERGYV